MKKLLKITLWTLLSLLLMLSVFFFFVFSQTGNEMLKPYVKQRLQEKIGMPVEVNRFKLDAGESTLDFIVNKQAVVNVITQYDLFGESFEGNYSIKAEKFSHEDIQFTKADLKGDFRGQKEDIHVDGRGMLLGGMIDFTLHSIEDRAQKIILHMKEAQLAELLQLNGYPALAQGKVDIEINMPQIGEDAENGNGHIVLKKAYFDRQLAKELYDYRLPENSYVSGTIDTVLEGKSIELYGNIQSNLFMLNLTNGLIDTATQKWITDYSLDVMEMGIFTQNKLEGPFHLEGNIDKQGKKVKLSGKSDSLGGTIHLEREDKTKITFDALSLEKLLILSKQPEYAKGEVSGAIVLDDQRKQAGTYDLQIDKGVLTPQALQKMSRYKITEENKFTLKAKGDLLQKHLTGNVTLKSTLLDALFTSVAYDLKEKQLRSDYDLLIHDVNRFIAGSNSHSPSSVNAEGSLKYNEKLSISGILQGVGEKVSFSYDDKRLKVDARNLILEKLFGLAGTPIYAKGAVNAEIDFKSLNPAEGTFLIKGDNLIADLKKKRNDKGIETTLSLDTSGTFKSGIGYIKTDIKSALGDISLFDMVYDSEKKNLKSSYIVDVPELNKLRSLIDRKLYGPLVLKGVLTKDDLLDITGETQTLGGSITYRVTGDNLVSTINNVPLENILGLLGHKKDFLGKAYGKGKYDLKRKSGVVDLDIKAFKVKPSSTTHTIKMLIGKDPARVIFDSTKFHADIKGKVTEYTLHAIGSNSSIEITDGRIDKINNTNTAKLKFVYEKYTVYGKIKGSIDDPKVSVDTSALFQDKIDEELQNKIEKALGGKAGDLLRKLKF